jgi:transposase InsO family protein
MWREIFEADDVRKAWRQRKREGFAVARRTVAHLMHELALAGAARSMPARTTVCNSAAPCPLDR